MRIPSRFFVTTILGSILGLCLFWSLIRLQLGVPTQSSRWCYEILNRKKELCRAAKGKKILLVGGSNVLFGMRAAEIEEALGVPTINYGLHAALTSPYILDLSKEVLNPGDTVVLALEYSGYVSGAYDDLFIDYVMARDPEKFDKAPWRTKLKWGFGFSPTTLIDRYTSRRKAVGPHEIGFPYDVQFLNEHGDQAGQTRDKLPADRHVNEGQKVLFQRIVSTSPGLQSVREFCKWSRENDIRVLATFPNIVNWPEFDTPRAAESIHTIEELYKSMGVPVLGTAQESMLPETDFFDTCYHLTEEAAKERTKRFLVHLKPFFQEGDVQKVAHMK
jgi:hypothetical protein